MVQSISVAMCTFNGSAFLRAQLESIAAQTRTPDELVICDDGSSDGSDAIAGEFARTLPFRTQLIRNRDHLGSTRNFQKAISLCQGDIVVLADQDDVWYQHKIDRIEKAFLAPTFPVAAFSNSDLIDDASHKLSVTLWDSFFFGVREQRRFANGEALKILAKHPVVTGATMAFRRNLFDLLSPFPANHVHDTWIAFLLAACGDIVPITEPLMSYRQHRHQQLGPGRSAWRERLMRARSTGPQFYLDEIERFQQLSERLKSRRANFPRADLALREIEGKISHREHRARLPQKSVARIPRVLREMMNGGYWRYSEGWHSVAKDMAGLFNHRSSVEECTDSQRRN